MPNGTAEIAMLTLESSGRSNWPGCVSPGMRAGGWAWLRDRVLTARGRLAELAGVRLRRVLVDNPFGKYPARTGTPEERGHVQTLLDQWCRCEADQRLHRVGTIDGWCRFVEDLRAEDIEVEAYIGYPEEDVGVDELAAALLPFILSRTGGYMDGFAIRPQDSWIRQYALNWGMPFVGCEAKPDLRGPLDLADLPSVARETEFNTPQKVTWALNLRSRPSMLYIEGHSEPAGLTSAVAWLAGGGRVYTTINTNSDAALERMGDAVTHAPAVA